METPSGCWGAVKYPGLTINKDTGEPLTAKWKIMAQNIQQINVARAPQLLPPRVTVSNMMDYSSGVMSGGALQNSSMSLCHSQSKPTGNSQSCQSSHYNPKKAIKLSPTLTALELGVHLQMHRLWPSGPPERQPCFDTHLHHDFHLYMACVSVIILQKLQMGFATAHCIQHRRQGWELQHLEVK